MAHRGLLQNRCLGRLAIVSGLILPLFHRRGITVGEPYKVIISDKDSLFTYEFTWFNQPQITKLLVQISPF